MSDRSRAPAVLLIGLLAGCSTAVAPPSPPPGPVTGVDAAPTPQKRAQAAAQAFASALRGQLQAQVTEVGPAGALAFCKREAPRIAADIQDRHRVRLGRVPVSGRLRNPANAPGDWQAGMLAEVVARARAGEPPDALTVVQTQDLPQGVALRMGKAIAIEPACLACHGTQLAEPVRAALAKHYPADTATGFAVGELRGMLWVEVPATP